MQSRDLIKKLEKLAPPEYAESWVIPDFLWAVSTEKSIKYT